MADEKACLYTGHDETSDGTRKLPSVLWKWPAGKSAYCMSRTIEGP